MSEKKKSALVFPTLKRPRDPHDEPLDLRHDNKRLIANETISSVRAYRQSTASDTFDNFALSHGSHNISNPTRSETSRHLSSSTTKCPIDRKSTGSTNNLEMNGELNSECNFKHVLQTCSKCSILLDSHRSFYAVSNSRETNPNCDSSSKAETRQKPPYFHVLKETDAPEADPEKNAAPSLLENIHSKPKSHLTQPICFDRSFFVNTRPSPNYRPTNNFSKQVLDLSNSCKANSKSFASKTTVANDPIPSKRSPGMPNKSTDDGRLKTSPNTDPQSLIQLFSNIINENPIETNNFHHSSTPFLNQIQTQPYFSFFPFSSWTRNSISESLNVSLTAFENVKNASDLTKAAETRSKCAWKTSETDMLNLKNSSPGLLTYPQLHLYNRSELAHSFQAQNCVKNDICKTVEHGFFSDPPNIHQMINSIRPATTLGSSSTGKYTARKTAGNLSKTPPFIKISKSFDPASKLVDDATKPHQTSQRLKTRTTAPPASASPNPLWSERVKSNVWLMIGQGNTCFACGRSFTSKGSFRYHLSRCHVLSGMAIR